MERIDVNGPETVVVDEHDETVKKLRPFRGLFWGLLLGIGLAGVLVFSATITLSILAVVVCIVVGLVVGMVWGLVGPAKQPKGPPPSTRVVVQQVPGSRFDDFDPPATAAAPVATAPTVADTPTMAAAEVAPAETVPDTPDSDAATSDEEPRPG